MNQQEIKSRLREKAIEAGFIDLKVSQVRRLDDEADKLQKWLDQGFHGEMSYMENHFEKRVDPGKLVPGAKSVISLAFNYFPAEEQPEDTYQVARYAYGKDYHKVLRKKLYGLLNWLNDEVCEVNGRVFTDSAPVLEREWAEHSGLGWKGKNTLLIHPSRGSYFFLAEMILDLELPVDNPMRDYCGSCTRCIEACPTDAIDENGYILDASKCISYATIEKKGDIPDDFVGKMSDFIFGCDICQEVCPWNRFSEPQSEEAFDPHPRLLELTKEEWKELSKDEFNEIFRKSAVKRTKYEGFMRNISFNEEE